MKTLSPNGLWDATIIKNAYKPFTVAGFAFEINMDRAIGGNGIFTARQIRTTGQNDVADTQNRP
jgi:hypothetical protein